MERNSSNALVQWLVAALLIVVLDGAKASVLCDIDSGELNLCYNVVTGNHPPKPNRKCCEVVKHANLPSLCSYKSILPVLGINLINVMALPSKCGLKTPPECKGSHLMPE
ncbi:hypothetical protein VNO78_17251 [Psophocarpus tetragonolobus]|uniref:Bifunctional inhibitor/plant lipid transfer protein/seed storage helical domain-containing protein n=1 Tax=Psophocarpus tetragonolobus TaxID=3891 RepID=A0AAN9SH61_PSOTE